MLDKTIAKAILDSVTVYGNTSVVPLRQLCGDEFVDQAIDLARRQGGVAAYFNEAVRQLARQAITGETFNTPVIKPKRFKPSTVRVNNASKHRSTTKRIK